MGRGAFARGAFAAGLTVGHGDVDEYVLWAEAEKRLAAERDAALREGAPPVTSLPARSEVPRPVREVTMVPSVVPSGFQSGVPRAAARPAPDELLASPSVSQVPTGSDSRDRVAPRANEPNRLNFRCDRELVAMLDELSVMWHMSKVAVLRRLLIDGHRAAHAPRAPSPPAPVQTPAPAPTPAPLPAPSENRVDVALVRAAAEGAVEAAIRAGRHE